MSHNNSRLRIIFWVVISVFVLLGAGETMFNTAGSEASPLVINEFVAANKTGLTDEDGDASDWIEIYNRSNGPVNLAGWSLTDDPNNLQKWTFPDITLGSHQYLVVFASAKNRKTTPLHTNFKLRQSGEFLALYNIFNQNLITDKATRFPKQFNNIAYGRRNHESTYLYFATPTPGQPNDERSVWQGVVSNVQFSIQRGFYQAPFTVELSTNTPDATIRYTTDGSEPTPDNGQTYTTPIKIESTSLVRAAAFKPNYLPSYVNTQTYIFLDDVLTQPANPPGFPATWGTHIRSYPGFDPSVTAGSPVVADYEMDPEIVTDPRYGPTLKNGLTAIPTLSLVTDIQHFTEIYANPREHGRAWERPASMELIHPHRPQQNVQINAGVRIQGGWGRWEIMPKHSFRLFFKDQYGAGKFKYPIFPNSPVDEFDTLVLRAGSHRAYPGKLADDRESYLHDTTYAEDEWLRASQIEVSGAGSHGTFVHLYINGLYWGLYNVVERPDTSFMAAYFGGHKSEWNAINQDGPVNDSQDITGQIERELINITTLDRADQYPAIEKLFDIDHFAEYIILHWYAGIHDWPENNWYAGRRGSSGPIRYFAWDGEITWLDGANVYLGRGNNQVKQLFQAMMQYPDFKIKFADRLYENLFNNGPLTDANAQARWLKINNVIEPAIVAESARWGDTRFEPPITPDDWRKARDNVLAQMEGNAAKLVALTREAGYYPPIDPPEFNQQGGPVPQNFELTMTAAAGTIYYTTNGSDPRRPGSGDVAPSAKEYTGPVPISATTTIKARTLAGATWSALHKATFFQSSSDHLVRLTELMYHPVDGNDYEFLELQNTGDTPIELAGISFEGIDFAFPVDTILNPGAMVVLVSNAQAFAQKYPDVPIGGTYRGNLSNTGETISLKDVNGDVIFSVTYDNDNGWPLSPDGRGGSLVLTDINQDPNNPKSWRVSRHPDGSPGQ